MQKMLIPIGGLLFLCAVLMGFYWLSWRGDMKAREAFLAHNMQQWAEQWCGTNGKSSKVVSFHYDNMISGGFPFKSNIRIVKPILQAQINKGRFYLSAAYIDVVVPKEAGDPFELKYLNEARAVYTESSGEQEDYFLYLSEVSPLLLRRAKQDNQLSSKLEEFAISFPQKVVLTVDLAGKSRNVAFQSLPMPQPVWQAFPKDMRYLMYYFYTILQHSMAES